jgi:polar amino acid transport system permease protein
VTYNFDLSQLLPYANVLLSGALVTASLSGLTVLFSFTLAIPAAAMRVSSSTLARALARAYVDLFRNSPLIVLLYFVYFGLGASIRISPYVAGLIGLILNSVAYTVEIYRGGIAAVQPGQWEAAASLGFDAFHMWRSIIIPQAIPRAFYPLGNQVVAIVLGSSLVMVISAPDLTFQALNIGALTFRYIESFVAAGLIYIVATQGLRLLWNAAGRAMFPNYRV